jgi:predicted glycoside hydrolase/deacetylase ChbG (UPF0249 family)
MAQGETVRGAVGSERITHLDTHQHLHLWPRIEALVCRLARAWGVPGVRVTRSVGGGVKGRMVNLLGSRLDTRARAAGLAVPEVFAGFDEAGAVTESRLVGVIDQLDATGASTAEIGVHPGEPGDADLGRSEWGYRWGDELDALTSASVRQAVERAGFRLGSFAALRPARS